MASDIIGANLEKQTAALKSLQAKRENYRPVATRGAILYDIVKHMGNINSMCQYSLQHFQQVLLLYDPDSNFMFILFLDISDLYD